MSGMISSLEQQLADLRAMSTVKPVVVESPPTTNVTLSLDDLRKLVKDMLGETVAHVQVPVAKEYTMLEAVNLALTGEEQAWLCRDEVIKGVANFMATDKGRTFTKQFITDYREYYES